MMFTNVSMDKGDHPRPRAIPEEMTDHVPARIEDQCIDATLVNSTIIVK
jgi:hypothetical protein